MKMKMKIILMATWAMIAATASAAEVTIETLLREMVNREANVRIPVPYYQGKQASSWDRTQIEPGGPNWFANKDYDQSMRVEQNHGRTEYVVMEDFSPGCVTRLWKPLNIQNNIPRAIIRFYLDGQDEPVLEGDFSKMLAGQEMFTAPFAEIASDERDVEHQISLPPGVKQFGGNMYFPIPYAKSCKITVEVPDGETPHGFNVFFYIINYRSYEAGTKVESFSLAAYEAAAGLRERVAKQLATPGQGVDTEQTIERKENELTAGEKLVIDLPMGSHAVKSLTVKVPAEITPDVLRNLWVTATFDGRDTVCCTFTEFFAGGFFDRDAHPSAPEKDGKFLRAQWNRNRQVKEDGTFASWHVMPYQGEAQIAIHNTGTKPIELSVSLGLNKWDWDERSMLFHSNWRGSETPYDFIDWNYLDVEGQGLYVGDTLSIYSPYPIWYGEGDERVYIDGEKFPSHLGTGTEDYYCYAWGMANYWSGPFFSAPARDSRGKADWRGYQAVSRERLLDGITFRSALRVDMEAWGRAGIHYSVGTMWYARPGATLNHEAESPIETEPIHRGEASLARSRIIEGESLKITKRTAGKTAVQSSAAWVLCWSENKQVFWSGAQKGDTIEFAFEVGESKQYAVSLGLIQAADYGVASFSINGEAIDGEFDQFSEQTTAIERHLGQHKLEAGQHTLTVYLRGKNPKSGNTFFGLDCIRLRPVLE